jgi:hypothetical protein
VTRHVLDADAYSATIAAAVDIITGADATPLALVHYRDHERTMRIADLDERE